MVAEAALRFVKLVGAHAEVEEHPVHLIYPEAVEHGGNLREVGTDNGSAGVF